MRDRAPGAPPVSDRARTCPVRRRRCRRTLAAPSARGCASRPIRVPPRSSPKRRCSDPAHCRRLSRRPSGTPDAAWRDFPSWCRAGLLSSLSKTFTLLRLLSSTGVFFLQFSRPPALPKKGQRHLHDHDRHDIGQDLGGEDAPSLLPDSRAASTKPASRRILASARATRA